MGLVVCPIHGNGFLFVCPHISTAVIAHSPCPGIQYLAYTAADDPALELACWFCPLCITDNHLPPNGTAILEADELMNANGALYRPMCPGCFNDWQVHEVG